MLKYNCTICNFHTDNKYNYKKHKSTKKHKEKCDNNILNGKKSSETHICEFCEKKLSRKSHLKKCNEMKIKKLEQEKDEEIKKIQQENKELKKKEKKLKKEHIELEKEYNEFLKKTAGNITNNNTLNMYYVINNFTDAHNFEDCINKPLTENEINKIIKLGPIEGCVELINTKCIKDIDLNKRPIHCLDASRNKFLVRSDDNWQVDLKGKNILKVSIPLLRARSLESFAFYGIPITKEIFEDGTNLNNLKDVFLKTEIINKILKLEQDNGHVQIIKKLINHSLLINK